MKKLSVVGLVILVAAGCGQQSAVTPEVINQAQTEQVQDVNLNLTNSTNSAAEDDNINTAVANKTVENENVNDSNIDTSDWLTYQNETLPLSFLYPEDWQLVQNYDGTDFTEILDNNDIYDHQLVNVYVRWSDRHEDIVHDSGMINPSLDKWLNCDYIYDLQSSCNTIFIDGIEVVKREGKIEPPFGDNYIALAYQQNNYTVVIDARSLLRELFPGGIGNSNLDGLQYINAVSGSMHLN